MVGMETGARRHDLSILVALGAVLLCVSLPGCFGAKPNPEGDDASFGTPDASTSFGDAPEDAPADAEAAATDAALEAAPDAPPPEAGASCGAGNGGCPPDSTCSIVDAGVVCTCNPGFGNDGGMADGGGCPSDCLVNNGGCDPNATCSNGATGVVCTCKAGFTGSGTSCASNDYTQWPAPPDDPLEPEYAVSADGLVVTDGVTGLTWQRQLFANPCPADGSGVCRWTDAQTYCASLNTLGGGGLEGITGWRLPSLVELVSIVNYGDGAPAIDTAIFPSTPLAPFWAHTADAADATRAWSLTFATGFSATQAVTTASYVRCVTSSPTVSGTPPCGTAGLACCYAQSCGPDLACGANVCSVDATYAQSTLPADTPPEPGYTVSPGGSVVTDTVTKLVWQRGLSASPCPADGAGVCTWQDAQAYCASLDGLGVGGYASGWRLPSVLELVSIVSYAATPTIESGPVLEPAADHILGGDPERDDRRAGVDGELRQRRRHLAGDVERIGGALREFGARVAVARGVRRCRASLLLREHVRGTAALRFGDVRDGRELHHLATVVGRAAALAVHGGRDGRDRHGDGPRVGARGRRRESVSE